MMTDLDHAVHTVLADIIATAPTPDSSPHGVSVVDAPSAPRAPRRLTLAAAACLVVTGLVGGGVALRARSSSPADRETSSTSSAPATTIANGNGPPLLPINALLPVSLPSGFSVLQADTDTSNAGQRYTVWSSCKSCSEPAAAVALVREGNDPLAPEQPGRDHQDVTIKGRTARYYPATNAQPEASLVSTDGREPGFLFNGWGIDLATLEDLAGGVIDDQDVPTHTGLVTVFDGQAGGLSPGLVNTDALLQVTYLNPTNGATVVYMYAHSTNSVDLAFQLWTQPFAKFTTVQGHRAITSVYGTFSKVVMQPDDNTVIVLLAQSTAVTLSDLTSIEFTMATPSDPRWAQMQQQQRQSATNGTLAGDPPRLRQTFRLAKPVPRG
jgi:hypothetical protein